MPSRQQSLAGRTMAALRQHARVAVCEVRQLSDRVLRVLWDGHGPQSHFLAGRSFSFPMMIRVKQSGLQENYFTACGFCGIAVGVVCQPSRLPSAHRVNWQEEGSTDPAIARGGPYNYGARGRFRLSDSRTNPLWCCSIGRVSSRPPHPLHTVVRSSGQRPWHDEGQGVALK
jgi:hypothetical protein